MNEQLSGTLLCQDSGVLKNVMAISHFRQEVDLKFYFCVMPLITRFLKFNYISIK